MADKTKTLEIPAIEMKEIQLTIVGDSQLIVHKWSEKAKKKFWINRR